MSVNTGWKSNVTWTGQVPDCLAPRRDRDREAVREPVLTPRFTLRFCRDLAGLLSRDPDVLPEENDTTRALWRPCLIRGFAPGMIKLAAVLRLADPYPHCGLTKKLAARL